MRQRQASEGETKLLKPTVFTIGITLVQIVAFGTVSCSQAAYNVTEASQATNSSISLHSLLLFCPRKRQQVWRFVSYMLVHTSYLHLANNMAFQVLLGVPLELHHKWWQVMAVYLAGVLGGSLASSVCNPEFPLAGASAGVYALIGAHLANFLLNWSLMRVQCDEDACSVLMSPAVQLPFVVLLAVADASVTVWLQLGAQGATRVSSAAHLGGLLGGFLVGLKALRQPKSKWPKLSSCFLALYCCLLCAALTHELLRVSFLYPPQS